MGAYQSLAVGFECKKDKLNKLLDICTKFGIDIPETNYCLTDSDGETMRVVHYDSDDIYPDDLYDNLVQLKEELIKAGAKDVSVRHTYPADLIEVKPKKKE